MPATGTSTKITLEEYLAVMVRVGKLTRAEFDALDQ